MSERLEEIKEAIAHELGLSDSYLDGTYLYYLTRVKSAFFVGTMTMDDFVEVDEELLEEIFTAIKPFFIEQAERVVNMQKLVNYHQQKQKEAEDANEPYRHQNKRYRDILTSQIMKDLIRLEDKGQFLPSDKREQFADFKWAIKALEESE